MNNTNQLPDLAASFEKFKLIDLIADCKDKSLFAQICSNQVHHCPKDVIQMISDQIKDNRVLVIEMFGKQVVTIIEKL